MARPPLTDAELIDRYGPHLNQAPPGGWNAGIEFDRVVDTHCCFCGQQCGIKLKVHDNEVVGFEPWYDFPFNEGKLCPKGVKRYLQGSHPDRLLSPLERDPSSAGGFRPVGWDHALSLVTSEIERIQAALNVLMTLNPDAARALVEEKEHVRNLEQALQRSHLDRLKQGLVESIETSNIHQETLRALKQVNTAFSMIAYPILSETGDLLASRLAGASKR